MIFIRYLEPAECFLLNEPGNSFLFLVYLYFTSEIAIKTYFTRENKERVKAVLQKSSDSLIFV